MHDRRLQRAPRVAWRNVGRDVLLAPPDTRGHELLTGAGGQLWRELAGGHTVAELVETLASFFGVIPREIRSDVERTVEELAERDLIRQVDER